MTDGVWLPVRDGDPRALALYLRHYSARKVRHGARRASHPRTERFIGPGEHMVLLSPDCSALFAWRHMRLRADNQQGIECTIFRNEGPWCSSALITEACGLARSRWGAVRLFTFVDPSSIASANPGYCFLKAVWKRLHPPTSRGLRILELLP